MAFNYSKLRGRITEICGTHGKLAKQLGVSERTLSLKLNNKISFKQNEIIRIAKILQITGAEIEDYFFTPKVHNCEQK